LLALLFRVLNDEARVSLFQYVEKKEETKENELKTVKIMLMKDPKVHVPEDNINKKNILRWCGEKVDMALMEVGKMDGKLTEGPISNLGKT
jgi:hypothetical protein